MMNMSTLTELYRHMEWADAVAWKAILASEKGATDAKIRDTFYHLHRVQHAFLRLWSGVPRGTPYPKFDEAVPLMGWGRAYYGEVFTYLDKLTDEQLAVPLYVPWAASVEERLGRTPDVPTTGETVLQVPMHSQLHRGQINARLREVGGEPPPVDFIVWIWFGKPEADWPTLPS